LGVRIDMPSIETLSLKSWHCKTVVCGGKIKTEVGHTVDPAGLARGGGADGPPGTPLKDDFFSSRGGVRKTPPTPPSTWGYEKFVRLLKPNPNIFRGSALPPPPV
jgi:hypothetical protein